MSKHHSVLTLLDIKARWNDVLDAILEKDRILWLAFFDARLVSFDGSLLTLDFRDSEKFSADHNFSALRKQEKVKEVEKIAQIILETPISISIALSK